MPDFKVQFKYSEDKKWAVIDIETANPFNGGFLAEILRNLADGILKEPDLNETTPQSGQIPGTDESLADIPGDDSKYCGAV